MMNNDLYQKILEASEAICFNMTIHMNELAKIYPDDRTQVYMSILCSVLASQINILIEYSDVPKKKRIDIFKGMLQAVTGTILEQFLSHINSTNEEIH